jgi:predicted AAA+ superfamily ATPase
MGMAIPIESKYRNRISSDDLNGLEISIERFNSPFGILINKNLLEVRGKILLVPLWLFLLMI